MGHLSLFLSEKSRKLLCCDGSLLLDAGSLTGELAQIVELCTTNLTALVYLNAVDVGRLHGEDTLYTHSSRHLAHGETPLISMAADLDDYATIKLDTLLGTLDDFVSDGYSVS